MVNWDKMILLIPRYSVIAFKTDKRYLEGINSGIEATVALLALIITPPLLYPALHLPHQPLYALQCFSPQEFIGELVVTGR